MKSFFIWLGFCVASYLLIIFLVPLDWKRNVNFNALSFFMKKDSDPDPNNSVTHPSFYNPNTLEVRPPAVLLHLKGGLGDQLFLYASHYAIARKYDWPLYIMANDDTLLKNFDVPLHPWNMVNSSWTVHNVSNVTNAILLNGSHSMNSVIQVGPNDFTQSHAFFLGYEKQVRALFLPKGDKDYLKGLRDTIQASWEPVAVHMDHANVSISLDIAKVALELLTKRIGDTMVTLFVFTKDPALKLPSSFNYTVHYITLQYDLDTLYLMTQCKHYLLLAPNTVAWWGAYLSQALGEKFVFATKRQRQRIAEMYAPKNKTTRKITEIYQLEYTHLYYPSNWFCL